MATAPETPLARRFAAALAECDPGRARIPLDAYGAAFNSAEPALATSPQRRARLADAIRELAEAAVLTPSRALDHSEAPPLPRFLVLLDRVADPPVGREAARYAWRPELAWAAHLPLRRSEFEALRSIQVFLRDGGGEAATVPTGERSLELFGDEKRLDRLRRNQRLFSPGRLSLEMLRARAHAPPFAYRRVGAGPVALVVENVATFHSALAALPPESPIGLVIFGAGGGFAASVGYLDELAAEGPAAGIREVRYFGDLDRRGLEIPSAADAAARAAGLPAVRPAIGLWARLLRYGRRSDDRRVDAATADHLVRWLPATLRRGARQVLVSGHRLAQEAVGTALLTAEPSWATWAELGPSGVERACDPAPDLRRPLTVLGRQPGLPTAAAALTRTDAGDERAPASQDEWAGWVMAGQTKNWVLGDPLLDWLDQVGAAHGLLRDDQRAGYDPRTDFRRFASERGAAFEHAVIDLLATRAEVVRIGAAGEDARSLAKARETIEALRSGVPFVAQAVLRNPERRIYGVVELLARSDILASWFPELLSPEDAAAPAPGLGLAVHYRAVAIKLNTLELTSDGHLRGSPEQLAHACQVWLYAEALGRIQGYQPPAAYVLGRSWTQGEHRGEGCLERLARVDLDRWFPGRQQTLEALVADAVGWLRRLRAEGSGWRVLPEPSVPELYPHARNGNDAPWHGAKRELALALGELTLLPGMTPARRAAAHAKGVRRWDDPAASAERLGIDSPVRAARVDAVLAANRAPTPTVLPERVQGASGWRAPAVIELYLDFETVSNLGDDFASLPRVGGQALIVIIGCGERSEDGSWRFAQWVVDELSPDEELRIIQAWIAHVQSMCAAAGVDLGAARLCHWSAAEQSILERAYDAARVRHGAAARWPPLPWFDALELFRSVPLAVTGAFDLGLKSIARAMHSAGFIATRWGEGPTDGLGAMAGVWSAAREASSAGTSLAAHPLMVDIARYNEVDCRVLAEVLAWLRQHR